MAGRSENQLHIERGFPFLSLTGRNHSTVRGNGTGLPAYRRSGNTDTNTELQAGPERTNRSKRNS